MEEEKNTELAVRAEVPAVVTGARLLEEAETWIKSKLLPSNITQPEQAAVIVLKGRELGLRDMASFEFIDVILGKPALKPKAMAALVRKGGVEYQTIKDFEPIRSETGEIIDFETVIRFYRGRIQEDVKYTYNDAKRLGLVGKDNWKKQPNIMMYWRCFSKGANRVCPDLIGGLYTTEELSSFTKNSPEIILTEDGDSEVIV